ncbi:MAG: segregation and condensation protein, partial [Fimbriimonadaceae bacterium]|nr:segregation and condensation protein [Fimbriimonadaceae bacterium]
MAARRETEDTGLTIVAGLGLVAPPPIHIQAPTFEGSLATLLRCVRDHKVQLLDVPLLPVCEAYFEYLVASNLADLDEAAAALLALAYLLERKAWALLPSDEPEPEPEEPLELPEPTVHEYAPAIEALKTWHEERARRFFRSADASPEPYELPFTLANVKVEDLAMALERVLRRAVPTTVEQLGKPRRSLSEQMRLVLSALNKEFKPLEEAIPSPYTREDAVYWFLALLELIRLAQVAIRVT